MYSCLYRCVTIIVFVLFMCVQSYSEVIFSDNFDNTSDWSSPEQAYNTGSDYSSSDGDDDTRCTNCPPDGEIYSGLFNARSSWSDYRGNRTMNISSTNARGGSGKAITFWMEPVNSTSCDGGTYW